MEQTTMNPGDSPLYDYVRLMVVLGGVLVLAWLALRYLLPKIVPGGVKGGLLEVVARQQIDARNSLYVVKAGSQYLLLGSGERGLTLLEHLDGEEVRGALSNQPRLAAFGGISEMKARAKS
jgi:flagellar biosynthetic protein FliO